MEFDDWDRITLQEIAANTRLAMEELRQIRGLLAELRPDQTRHVAGGINAWTFLTFITVLAYVLHRW